MWRQAPSKGPVLLALQRFPGLEEMLSESEKAGNRNPPLHSWYQPRGHPKAKLETGPSVSSAIEPAELWEEMKETKGRKKTRWTKKIRCKHVSGNSLSSEPVDLVRQVAVLKLWINWWPWLDSKRWRHILSQVDMCMLSKSIWNHRFHCASVGYFFCLWNIVHVNGQATAVALYKSALQFQKMSPETRKANSMALTLVKHPF